MGNPFQERIKAMKRCSIRSCPGEYEEKRTTQVFRRHGEVYVLENVLVKVCDVCGDTLVPLSTAEAIEALLTNPGEPDRTAPVYEMPDSLV
jgi:YgiT-type zinc finger domain-containing protein